MFRAWLAHPLTKDRDIDDPNITHLRRRIIQEKPFLRKIYQEWYAMIGTALPTGNEPILELGSGAGFMCEIIQDLITTEIFYCPNIDAVVDGQCLPFADGTLRGIVMTDVLHHIPQPRRFFAEAARCVRSGGSIIAIEPWVSSWSRLIYTKLHHEPFHPYAKIWEFPATGPLSGANGALPWIIFERDHAQFEQEFPQWQIQMIKPMMPFRYLISGGVSMRNLMPGWTFSSWRRLEWLFQPWMNHWAMFAQIVLRKVDG
ncbi:MAG: class I SAM-dependent methyltransferase [Thioploca sp.]|nr:class I SAM-dependent methyltransferase [Thioploca sp.]